MTIDLTKPQKRCDGCAHWERNVASSGECRAAPPVAPTVDGNGMPVRQGDRAWGIWPSTRSDDWCGHHQPRAE